MKVFNWIFAIFCILCLPVFGFHAGSVFMCLLGIVSLPVKPVKKIWNMLPKSKILRPVIIGSLFVIFCYMIPTDSNQSDIVAEISTESSEIIQGSEAVKNEPSETEKLETETSKLAAEETEKVIESTDTEIETEEQIESQTKPSTEVTISVSDIPEYSGKPYVEINGNTNAGIVRIAMINTRKISATGFGIRFAAARKESGMDNTAPTIVPKNAIHMVSSNR